MRILRPTIAVLLLLAFAGPCCGAGFPMTVKDSRGKTITIKARPMRIVSLTPNNTEILFAIGLNDRIVGVTKYCNYPAQAKDKPKVGDMSISAEAVIALKPDLVVAHSFMNDSVIPRLEKLGLTVFAIDPKTISETARDIRTLGEITARPKTAESVAKQLESAVESVEASRANKASRKVLVVIQSNPLWAAGPKTFVDEMLEIANAKNVAADARPGFVTFSRECAISRNPNVIVVGVKSDIDYLLESPIWKNTDAVRNKRVYVIDHDTLVRPGPRLADGLKQLAAKLNY